MNQRPKQGIWIAFAAGLALVLGGCSPDTPKDPPKDSQQAPPEEHVHEAQSAVFVNGDFESGANNLPPPSWTVTPYLNPNGVTIQNPQTRAGLNLQAGGVADTFTFVSAAGPETQTDSFLGAAGSMRWPKFGNACALVNRQGTQTNVNSLRQSMTIVNGDIDPTDGIPHVRFVLSPVLENPAHQVNQQPYYFVQLTNITKGNAVLYADFNLSAQPGVPWKTVGTYYYTDWQLVDIAPGPAQLGLGDQVELEIIGAGCSLGGHWGNVYVDSVGVPIPGLFVTGTGPAQANAGSNITYKLTYKNGGANGASGVKVEFNIPPNTTFQSINPNGLVCVTPPVGQGGLVTCSVNNLAAGAGGTFDITVQINAGAMGSIVAGNYDIYGTNVSPLIGPKIITQITAGVVFADLKMTKTDNVVNVIQGQPVTYTIVASNSGPNPVVGAAITDTFPAQLSNVSWTCVASAGSACGAAAGVGNINTTANIAVNGTVTYTATATVAANAAGQIANVAAVTPPANVVDPTVPNASATDIDTVTPCPGFGSPCTAGVGECLSNGTKSTCLNNVAICDAVAKQPSPEVCDNKDNNCNGQTDEGNPGGNIACNTGLLGVCAPGTTACQNGAVVCNQNVQASAETCDNKDNNCNGQIDENNPGGNQACNTGLLGECAAGTTACQAGSIHCNQNVQASVETCDNKDNNCNGQVDENNPGGNIACNTGLLGVCAPGTTACQAGSIHCNQNVQASAESCDDLDNNCNGQTDEGFNKGQPCNVGLGVCAASGVIECKAGGGAGCSATPGQPSPEVCGNDLDEDCDGQLENGCPDSDGDGLSDALELLIGSDPNDADTDDDGLLDGNEPSPGFDSDGDGLINVLDPDSDNDGLTDGTEAGKDCSNPATDNTKHNCVPDADMGATTTNPMLKDTDGGGVFDGAEDTNLNGKIDPGETDPTAGHGADDSQNADSDNDGMSDALELTLGSNPNDADTDDDGVLDGQEPNPSLDTDGDGLLNVLDPDSDNDGLFDGTELGKDCTSPATDSSRHLCIADADAGQTKTSPLDPDTDHGGVKDGSEDTNRNGVVDGSETNPVAGHGGDDSVNLDSDGDGLSDGLEIALGSNPNDADTDDDGVIDGQEPNPAADMDGDGLVDVLDPDSDDDGLTDGTEMGKDCSNPATDPAAHHCTPDADQGATKTSAVDPDSDNGGKSDGAEDWNLDGKIDPGEGNPTAGHGSDDAQIADTDGDGLSDALELFLGSNPNDADTDDDGVIDGQEPNPSLDMDGDGLIDVLDPDSDDDGLFDGTEMGKDCSNAATNAAAHHCTPDADQGATKTSPIDPDTDHGGATDGSEDTNLDGKIDPGETDPTAGHKADDATVIDSDGDGLSDKLELFLGSNPNDADTDDDGALDGLEPNPSADMDGDGLIDVLDPDSDDDALPDGTEMGKDCSNPATDNSRHLCTPDADMGATKTSAVDPDTDNGGKKDGSEDTNLNGKLDAGETNPTAGHGADDNLNTDSDGDGLPDALEIFLGSNPNDADTDDDGVVDGQEPNPSLDMDGDGLIDVLDVDSDNDGLYDGTELGLGCNNPATDNGKHHCIPDADMGATHTSPVDPDSDDGGIMDGVEDVNHNGVLDAGETNPAVGNGGDDVANVDSDGDGLTDAEEIFLGTNPNDADTDDDGAIDGKENNLADDTDGDGLINALDVDSDNDGLFDGTEMGLDCENPDTDKSKNVCIADADMGATVTCSLLADTDHGGVIDGEEDANHNGQVDADETDPVVGHGGDDTGVDSDNDGITNIDEMTLGTDPLDADSDDDGVLDGQEPKPGDDTDGDGKINALDPDSDNDGLFDGTEMGKDCGNPATDLSKKHCIPDGDKGQTTTDPLDADTDDGTVKDGDEDKNHNGVVDAGETDPTFGHGDDDVMKPACTKDSDCGDAKSGKVCEPDMTCGPGCRGKNGNGCPEGKVCDSLTESIGTCVPENNGGGGQGGGTTSTTTGGEHDEVLATGDGIFCAARPGTGSESDGAPFVLGTVAAIGLALRRRRRG
ncbi:MAG: MopE-related protein [Byssovorax sp.]